MSVRFRLALWILFDKVTLGLWAQLYTVFVLCDTYLVPGDIEQYLVMVTVIETLRSSMPVCPSLIY